MMEELRSLGLTEYEAKVYTALLRAKTATGGQVAKASKVPHGKTYEALHSLSEKGLVTILPVEPKLFKVVEPDKGLKVLIERKTAALREAERAVLESSRKIAAPPKEEAVEKLEVYSGIEKQYELAGRLMDETKKQLLILSRGEKVPYAVLHKGRNLIKRGIDYRLMVYEFDGNREWIKKFVETGLEVRHFKTGEFTLAIRDKEEVLLVIRNPKNLEDRITLLFRDKAIAIAMATYFETIWKNAIIVKV
jgi:sugar-specific transcriptional regulator TrmB